MNISAQDPLATNQTALSFLRAVADSLPAGFCFIDKAGIVLVWNTSNETIYKVGKKAIIGRPVTDFFPTALVDQVRLSRETKRDVVHSPRKGTHVLISASPVFANGALIGAISTERAQGEVSDLSHALEQAQTKLKFLENEILKTKGVFSTIIGHSPEFMKQVEIAKHIAPTDISVMISGESGTGKEIFARGIHELSKRPGLFIPINCSAIPSELFESEFFGYVPGAFTGASSKGKAGFFELAHEGTLFLDEIGDLPYPAQAKLLRVLQENRVVRVGSAQEIPVNVRIISATNKDLKKMMREEHTFREDLFYRLNVLEITIPPLCRRRTDIPLLVNYFIQFHCKKNSLPMKKIEPAAMKKLVAYNWPGNIRELMNVVENMVVINRNGTITSEDLSPCILVASDTTLTSAESYPMDLKDAVRILESCKICQALALCRGNKSKAAEMLKIPRTTLYKKINEYDIE